MDQITVQFMVVLIMVPIMGVIPLQGDFLQLAPITLPLVLITPLSAHITHQPALITPLQVTFLPNPAMPFHPHLAGWDDMD